MGTTDKRPWTKKEDAILLAAKQIDESLAKRLKRSVNACYVRRSLLRRKQNEAISAKR